jgi:hypothetical protein
MSSHALVVDRKTQKEERDETASSRRSRPVVTLVPRKATIEALGGEPRVSLLPVEVNDYHRAKTVRRRLGVGVFIVLLVVVAGVGAAYFQSVQAQASLDAARATSQNLVAQEAQFVDLRKVQSGMALVQAGQAVGGAPDIDWKAYLEKLQVTLPAGVVINGVVIESSSPFVDFAQSTIPLEGSRVATLSFTATSPTIPSIPVWLDGLAKLPGFADAVPGSVTIQTDGSYLVNITMHINADAFSHRYAGGKK